jgi:hypothetical protein
MRLLSVEVFGDYPIQRPIIIGLEAKVKNELGIGLSEVGDGGWAKLLYV